MKVKSRDGAWRIADKLFPTDYMKDDKASENAGYPIYFSTQDGNNSWISDIGTRLEININDGTKIDTKYIYIEEEEKETGMKATIRSVTNQFEEYNIVNIVSVQYIGRNLVLTYINNREVYTNTYNTNDVIIEIH